ncbi:MAG: IS66 family insertion sequence element accessory protein TnpB [bacterium]|nr:IS66 family insertion sequence element accessory protein TnpB [bacterium]
MAEIKSRAFWEAHVSACEASGSKRAAYCRRHELNYWTFNEWRRRLGSTAAMAGASRQALVPVMVSSARPTAGTLELCVGDQVRLSLPASVDAVWLGALLRSAAAC